MRLIWCLVEAMSALVYLAGALAVALAGVWAWLYVIVLVSQEFTWVAGLAVLALTFWGNARFEPYIKRPWQMWTELWLWADERIAEKRAGIYLAEIDR